MSGLRETILILDKESHNRWVLKTLLENERYIVIANDSIERAIQNFSEFEVSGFISEHTIDRVCTVDAIRELKKRFPEAYVMMLTDNDLSEKEYEEMIEAGVDDYFLKPLSSKKILLHLKKGLKYRSIMLQRNRLERELSRIKGDGNPTEPITMEGEMAPQRGASVSDSQAPLPQREAGWGG